MRQAVPDLTTSLTRAFDEVWGRLLTRLEGLGDDEYFWEPVPDCWTIRQRDDGRWAIDADGGGGPAPDPAPITTIAWRVGHIGLMLTDFGERLFVDREITLEDVEFAPSATAAVTFLERSYRHHWRERIGEIVERQWWHPIGSAFGAYADLSTADLALHVLDELTHHAAEVALLRDLYQYRNTLR